MSRVFNQWIHAGERHNGQTVITYFGLPGTEDKRKKGVENAGYLIICKCGYGYMAHDYTRVLRYPKTCPYCGRKMKGGN